MTYALAAVWLVLAFLLNLHSIGRRIAAYLGSILAFVHLLAVIGGQLFTKLSRDGVPSLNGYFGGILAGLAVGIFIAPQAFRKPIIFWTLQLTAALFLAFLPLF